MVPNGWSAVTLADLVTKSAFGPRFTSELYSDDGAIGTIRTTDLSDDGEINYRTIPYANLDTSEYKEHILKDGDLLITRSGTCGIPCIFSPQEKPIIAGAFLIRFQLNSKANSTFLHELLKSPHTQAEIGRMAAGGVQKNLTGTSLKKLKIQLPPLLEQRKIAKILSTWDKAIATTERLIETSKQQEKALMQQLLTGKKRFDGFGEEWQTVQIKHLGTVVSGGTPSTDNPLYWDGFIDWITPTDITRLNTRFVSKSVRRISREGLQNCSAKLVPEGSLLVCTRATIGEMAITSHETCTNQGFKNIIPNEHTDIEFLYYLLKKEKQRLISKASGSTFLEISKKDFESIFLKVPCYQEQKKIASVLTAADREIENLSAKLVHFKLEKKALMQQLLTGKRRVKVATNNYKQGAD